MKERVYISGAITGATAEEMAMFAIAAQELRERDYKVFNPVEHDVPEADTKEEMWTRALCRDIRIITHCAGIAVLPTFTRSKGALLEIFNAISLRKRVILIHAFQQDQAWEHVVLENIKRVQTVLWQDVARERFLHHTDLPTHD